MEKRWVRGKGLKVNQSYEAEPLEITLRRAMTSSEPISTTAPQVFTERKEGVRAEYDIRTDRFEVAMETMDRATKAHIANRENAFKEKQKQEQKGEQSPSGTSDPK